MRFVTPKPVKKPSLLKERAKRQRRYQARARRKWIDPFSEIIGTLPEKMLYAELVRRGVPFRFQAPVHFDIPYLSDRWHRADFLFPDLKIMVEVQGTYWHTKPDQIEKDATLFAFAELAGWRVYAWWDTDIQKDVRKLCDSVPEFYERGKLTSLPINEGGIDDTKGAAKAGAKRRGRISVKRQKPPVYRKPSKRKRNPNKYTLP